MKRIFSGIMLILLVANMLTLTFNIQPVEASGTIYIRADGSIDPPTANITTTDNVTYIFTGNINDSIVVERDSIVVDGAGYTVQGIGSGTGIFLSGRSNVTITNTNVENYYLGIYLTGSSLNIILGNNIIDNGYAIYLDNPSNNNIMLGNNITNNSHGIYLSSSSSNSTISGNNITNNNWAILILASFNTISGNNVANNYDGIVLQGSSSNTISENNITANSDYGISLYDGSSSNTIWGNNVANNDNLGITLYSSLQSSTTGNNTIWENNVANNHDGIVVYDSDNNTISENNITANSVHGVYLAGSSYGIYSSFNAISGNNITNNGNGIYLDMRSINTTISGNNVANNYDGVVISGSSGNAISGNNITANNYLGVYLDSSSSNTISENNITNNEYGVQLLGSPSNRVFHNNFINNAFQALVFDSPFSVWDDGYPSGGNYWSDYTGVDVKSGPNQDQPGSDGIGDTSYFFDYGRDRYPFMNPLTPVHDVAVTDITLSKTVVGQGYSLNINVTVANQGDYEETFNVTLYANTTSITTQTITLTNGTSTTITFIWNTTGFAKGNYTIWAYAEPVPDETNTADNTFVGGWVVVTSHGWELDFTAPTRYPIVDFAVYNGSLYAAADNKLYVYNGSWNALIAPTFVTSLEPYKDKLVVGGQGGLHYYDGTSFGLIFSVPTYIKALGVYDNRLYAGTMLDKPLTLYYCNGSCENPSNWYDDTDFTAMLNFSGAFGSIDPFAVYDNVMYVGSGGTLYSFNGTSWSIAASYADVYAFLDVQVYNGKLYFAMRDQAWRKPVYQGGTGFSGRVIQYDGENWITIFEHDYWIYSLGVYDGKLYAGTANAIFTYNGVTWETSYNATEGAYYALCFENYDDKIYVGMGNGYIFADPAETASPPTPTVPEFPSFIILLLFMIATLLTVIVYRRKTVSDRTG